MAVVALILAIVAFVLAGLGVHVGDLGELDLVAFGLALVAVAMLVGIAPTFPRR